MQIIEKQNELLSVQQKFDGYQKRLEKTFNNTELEGFYQKEICQSFENINKKISEINFLISKGKTVKACNKTIELVKIIFELSKKLKKIEKIKISESIINDSCFLTMEVAIVIAKIVDYKDKSKKLDQQTLELIYKIINLLRVDNSIEIITAIKKEGFRNIDRYISAILYVNQKISRIRKKLDQKNKEFGINNLVKSNLEKVYDLSNSISDLLKYTLNANKDENQDAIITIQNVTWQEYENIVETIGEASWCRVSYLDGVLQLMSPGINHERVKEGFSLIIQLYCIKNNIKCFAFGSSDLKKKKTKGKQPDTAFSFFEDKENPDLAVEANFTSGGIDDLKIYTEIEVPEVWIYDIRNKTRLYSLIDKEYKEITVSKYLKDLTPAILNEIIQVALKGSINDVAHSLDTFMSSCDN